MGIVITGHRGSGGLAPENTILSVEKGLQLKVDRIEIDVHQTNDNVVVVLHDNTINRTTNGEGIVKKLNYSQIKKFNIKSEFHIDHSSLFIPTLDDILNVVNGKTILLIEIKRGNEDYPKIEENIIEVIRKHDALAWCIIQSFDLNILQRINSLEKNIKLHYLCFGKIPFLPIWISNKIYFKKIEQLGFINEISIFHFFVNNEIIEKTHQANKKINVWTIDNLNRLNQLVSKGVDGIITNFPNRLSAK